MVTLLSADGCKEDSAEPPVEVTSSFAALVVADAARSEEWYRSVLGMTLKTNLTDGTATIVILTSKDFELELLELQGSLSRQVALESYPTGTQIQGLFQAGFKIDNVDVWIAHLTSLQIDAFQVFTDPGTGKRNLLVEDPDGNLIQFFE